MKVRKIHVAVTAGMLGVALLGGCGNKADDAPRPDNPNELEVFTEVCDFPTGGRVELDKVLYDDDSLKVSATGFGPVMYYAALNLDIENKTDQQMQVYVENNSLNGWTWDASLVGLEDGQYDEGIEVTIAPGETVSCGLGYSNTKYLEPCQIEQMAQIGFMLAGHNTETGEELVRTPELVVDLPAGEGYTQQYDSSGTVVFDQDGIRVIAHDIADNGWGGYEIPLYVENLSNRAIKVYQTSRTIDGTTTDEEIPTEIACAAAGKRALASLWTEEELTAESAYEVSLRVSEVDPNTFEEIAEIGACVVTNAS